MNRKFARVQNIITALAVVTLGTVIVASPGVADGNNGTVKVDGWTLDHGTGNGAPNRNEPHLDCVLDVEWYNYDASVTSTVTFEMQAPTQDVVLGGTAPGSVPLDNDDASGASAAGLDGVQRYTLTFAGDPHPVHGYHVKLTVNTPISNGADVKHKVFWVEGCAPPPECPNGDLNGEDPGCEPPECPNGDLNGDEPGCDPPPPSCPPGQMDWNGPNVEGCGNPPEQPDPVVLEETVEGCVLTQYGIDAAGVATRTGVREYVWVPNEPPTGNGSWQLEPLANVTWSAWTLTEEWTGEKYFEECADDQPPALVREVAGVQASCRLQGTLTWVDVYTTEFVWNEETQTWEPGTETGPVRTNEEFVKYTDQQFQNQCAEEPEVAGEQGNDIKHELPEVKGEQAAVPGAVNAGLGTTPTPMGAERNPLWLLAVAGGLGLIGVAGRRRRPTADR